MSDAVVRWREEIGEFAVAHGLSPLLVAAVVATESGGEQYAQRVERGFWSRYSAGIAAWVRRTASKSDDLWSRYPDIYASSYGLMQVMLQTAAEHGFTYRYPGELFDPGANLNVGCFILKKKIARQGGDVRLGLLAYNGGADVAYPDRVLKNAIALHAAGHWTTEALPA